MSGCDDLRVRGEILLTVTGAYAAVLEAHARILDADNRRALAPLTVLFRDGEYRGSDPDRIVADAEADLHAALAGSRQAMARWEALMREHGTWLNRRD